MIMNCTIKKEAVLSGVGIHSGKNVDLILKPSTSGEIIIRLKDQNNLEIRVDPRNVKAKRSSTLESDAGKVLTIEHLLAVLYIFGLNSIAIELDGGEIPIMDGSAEAFVKAVQEAGIQNLSEQKKIIRIKKPKKIEEEDAYVSFFPDPNFRITYNIVYDHPLIKSQKFGVLINEENFIKEIAPARTFGFLKEVPSLLKEGLAKGGSLTNAIVLDDRGILGSHLRFPDEFVRHKILDFIGDISLLGHPVLGHFKAFKAGHSLHLKAVHFLLDNPEYWE